MEPTNLNIEIKGSASTVLFGEALTPQEPVKTIIKGVINAPLQWLAVRTKEFEHTKAHITVDRDKMSITLQLDEGNHYGTSITGSLQVHPIYALFGINSGRYRTTFELAELIKMNRAYFENRQQAMELVTQLRQFKAKIDKQVAAEFNPNKGDKKACYSQTIDSNLPPSFEVKMPLFKGQAPVVFEVETYFNPDDLTCSLVSAASSERVQDEKDTTIDAVISQIKDIAPEIAILEI